VNDDDLETIDLERDPADEAVSRARRTTCRASRRRIAIAGCAALVVGASGALFAASRSGSSPARAAPDATSAPALSPLPPLGSTTTTWTVPARISGLLPGRYVAVVGGTPILVGDGAPRQLVPEILADGLVNMSARGSVLVGFGSTTLVLVGPTFDGTINTLPSPIRLLPDSDGRWWSNFGELEVGGSLHPITLPRQTEPVAKLAGGYLLVDRAHTRLLVWRPRMALTPIGLGRARVLAVAGDLVAWSDDAGAVVHITDVSTVRTTDVQTGSFALTARFSPDRTRLAIRVDAEREYVMLADRASGDVLADLATSPRGGGLPDSTQAPPALQPAPFSWTAGGALIVDAQADDGQRFLLSVDRRDGSVHDPVAVPAELRQLVVVAS
jgi:hypothetical protein